MRYNVQYVDNKGELLSDSVESHDVRGNPRSFHQFPDTRIFKCVPANLDNLEGSEAAPWRG